MGSYRRGAISKRNDQQTSDVNYHHFTYRTHAKEVSPAIVSKMFQYEFTDDLSEDRMSYEDRKFLDTVHKGVMMVDDHFEIPLPFKDEAKLPINKVLADQRLNGLKNIIDKGYAERIDENDASQDGSIWYIPHHGVYHPKKPGKIHIVFDCSAEYQGDSLNEDLLQGPDYTNNLAGVLCRFRRIVQEKIAFVCDIEGMFHQVSVTPEDRNYLRFLLFENSDVSNDPMEFLMTVHLFGVVSSPSCANFALC